MDEVPQSQLNPLDAPASCDVICSQLAGGDTGITAWQLQCRVSNVLTPIDFGEIGSTEPLVSSAESVISDAFETDFSKPNLGVEIPGLNFSDSSQRVNTSEGVEIKVVSSNYLGEYIEAIYGWLLAAGALVAIVLVMVGGLEWMLATGNTARVTKAKERISRAAIGIVLLLSAYSIAYLIDPSTVTFSTLDIPIVERVDFIPNETPLNFPKVEKQVLSSVDTTGGVGWNDFIIFDQTLYGSTPYGPERCMIAANSSSWGTGNLKSSGCGIASFTGVLHTYGYKVPIAQVAQTFYEEDFRPLDSNGCGKDGTNSEGFINSSLVDEAGLVGKRIVIGDRITEESKQEILQALVDKHPVISSYRTDSGGGHFVVLVGLDENDNILINNPWGATKQIRTQADYFSRIKSAVVIKKK
ncbi:MAG: C39 family peptidase [Patescibacteria group bacterium]|nr:C39 family peptidase [Patescibacteria group bacterium]